MGFMGEGIRMGFTILSWARPRCHTPHSVASSGSVGHKAPIGVDRKDAGDDREYGAV